jgi:(p)ppGpp synthase/HD superfamily hydrolase
MFGVSCGGGCFSGTVIVVIGYYSCNSMVFLSQKVLEAFEFAAFAHQGQFRKNPGNIPYFSHPAAVGLILGRGGFRDEVVIAGLLHDVIEDTLFKEDAIRERFGEEILQLVMGVTEDKGLKWDERKQSYNNHLQTVSEEILAISGADLLANRTSLLLELQAGRNPWNSFSKNPKIYMEKMIASDYDRIAIIKQRLNNLLVEELELVEQEVIKFSNKLEW